MIKRLIFDVDGTLITGVNFNLAVKSTLYRLGIYSDLREKLFLEAISSYEKEFNNYNKIDYIKYFERVLGVMLDDSFLNIFFEELKKCVPVDNEKLKAVISELSKKYELVLLTNYFKESQLNRLHSMGIDNFFLECYGEELIKPNEQIYIKTCGKHAPCECVMIGDDVYLDIEGAKKMGLNTILVDPNDKNNNDFSTITINSVMDLSIDLIEGIWR